jgi:hypothetical protein
VLGTMLVDVLLVQQLGDQVQADVGLGQLDQPVGYLAFGHAYDL